MSAIPVTSNAAISLNDYASDDVVGLIYSHLGQTPQIGLSYEPRIKTLWLTLAPEPRPVFTLELLSSINKVQRAINFLWGPEKYAKSPVRFLAYMHNQHGPVFTLGGDLEFYLECIAKNDRAGLEDYARQSIEGVIWNASSLRGAAITLAAVRGLALGGGIDAPRSSNVMIAERQATFSYPEIKFNHFPIGAVAVLSRVLHPRVAHEVLSGGKEYSAEEFARIGALEAVVGEGESEAWLRRYATDNLKIHAAQLALFQAFYKRSAGAFEEELADLAERWVDHMIRLTPIEISHLQKIVKAQDHFLLRAFQANATSNAQTRA